ncbi:MAG: zinc ribbon domain-containing protein [Dehalococcoidia bacterium]|nr:zinc ribbon domain-containing protein [Dehalococcoidia bacterium]
MPLYEYVCQRCEQGFELLRPMSRSTQGVACPTCEAPAVRVLSVFAAFATGSNGESTPVAGGGCACASGGACGCAR